MTPTAALAALVAAVMGARLIDTGELRFALAQAQAVLAQEACGDCDPVPRDIPTPVVPQSRREGAATTDETHAPQAPPTGWFHEVLSDFVKGSILEGPEEPEALAARISAALRDELERPSDLRIVTWTWLEAAILRAIQETPR